MLTDKIEVARAGLPIAGPLHAGLTQVGIEFDQPSPEFWPVSPRWSFQAGLCNKERREPKSAEERRENLALNSASQESRTFT